MLCTLRLLVRRVLWVAAHHLELPSLLYDMWLLLSCVVLSMMHQAYAVFDAFSICRVLWVAALCLGLPSMPDGTWSVGTPY